VGARPSDLTGPYFLRYSLAGGSRPWEHVGDDLDEAIADRKQLLRYVKCLREHAALSRLLRLAACYS